MICRDELLVPHDRDEVRDNVKILHIKRGQGNRLKRMMLSSWQILQKARHLKADLYHFHDLELIPVGMILCLGGAKVIYDVHEDVPRQTHDKHYLPALVKYPMAMLVALAEWIGSRLFFSGIIAATPRSGYDEALLFLD